MSQTLPEIVKKLEESLQCNCDLDNWEPERDTGHSWVCRIHKEAVREFCFPSKKGDKIVNDQDESILLTEHNSDEKESMCYLTLPPGTRRPRLFRDKEGYLWSSIKNVHPVTESEALKIIEGLKDWVDLKILYETDLEELQKDPQAYEANC